MKVQVIYLPETLADIDDILVYLAAHGSPKIAARLVNNIVNICESFGEFPHRGTMRDDILDGLRTYGWKRTATIAFRIMPDNVQILGIFYRGRDVEAALGSRQI